LQIHFWVNRPNIVNQILHKGLTFIGT